MKETNKKILGIGAAVVAITVLVTALLTYQITYTLYIQGHIGWGFSVNRPYEIHAQITIYQGDTLIFSQYHAGAVTNLGDNQTLYKVFGNSTWQYGDIPYLDNATFISIGNQGSLSTSSTVLPGEWNRTDGAISKNTGQSILNISATFYPDAGPYTADCIGGNFNGTAEANNLAFYDTFPEVTNINDSFTIIVEFSITVSHT